jgi:hypothetical protein
MQPKYRPSNGNYIKLMKAMVKGEIFTAAKARNRFNIINISAEATRIRKIGLPVNIVRRVAGNNRKVTEYVLG